MGSVSAHTSGTTAAHAALPRGSEPGPEGKGPVMSSPGPPPERTANPGPLKGGPVFRAPAAGAARAAPAPRTGAARASRPARPGETIHFNAVGAAARRLLGLGRVRVPARLGQRRRRRLLLRTVVARGRLGLVGIGHPAAGSASAALRAPSATMAAGRRSGNGSRFEKAPSARRPGSRESRRGPAT